MIRPNLILDLNHELIVDNFAGGGGASTGIERALGRHVDHAINHDSFALGMHRINHAQTVHHCEDVFDVDPLKLTEGRPVGMGWFSPDCKHFSKAKGGKPLSKKIRGLAFVILSWAKIHTRVIYMENVEEIQTWGPLLPDGRPDPKHKGRTWKSFLAALGNGVEPNNPDLAEMLEVLGDSISRQELIRGFGYQVDTKELRACDYGTPTIRKRLFLIARCDGSPIVWPMPTHANPQKPKNRNERIIRDALKKDGYLKPWVPVSTCIDWDVPCHSIFLTPEQAKKVRCRRPLAASTMRRIATGIDRYVLKSAKPFIVSLMIQTGHLKSNSKMVKGADEPMRCQVARPEHGIAVAHLTKFTTGAVGQSPEKPLPTIAAGSHSPETHGGAASVHGMVAADIVKLRGTNIGHPADEPGHAQSAGGTHHGIVESKIVAPNLIAYYDNDKAGQAIDDPSRTVTVRERFGFVESELAPGLTEEQISGAKQVSAFLRDHGVKFEGEFATLTVDGVQFVIVDIGMRMLTARELFRAQGFGNAYIFDRAWLVNPKSGEIEEIKLTKEQQIRMCGNSVCPDVAEAIVRANSGDLAIWNLKERKRFQRGNKIRSTCQA